MSAGEVRGPLPPGWAKAPIGELCELVNGRAFKPEEWTSEGLPIIRIQNLNNHAAKFNRFSGTMEAKHRVSNGDLLFAWSGTPGTSFGAHLWHGGDAVLNQHIFNVLHGPWVIRDYMRLAMNSRLGSLIDQAHGGAGLAHVTKPVLERTEIPLPPLAEQRRIVAKLDAVMAQLREARAALEAVPALLEQYRRAVLAAAFRGELTADWRAAQGASDGTGTRIGQLPSAWSWATLETVASIHSGLTKNATARRGGVPTPLVTVASVQRGRIDVTGISSVDLLPEDGERGTLKHGDVLFVEGNGSRDNVGRVAIWRSEVEGARHQNHIFCVRGRDMGSSFIAAWFDSPLGRAQLTQGAVSATGLYSLSVKKLGQSQVPLPPLAEQHEIVRRVEAALGRIARVKQAVEAQRQQLDALERAVLDKAFRGALVPQHPDDEPADAMLARLRAQRAAAGIAPKGRRGRPRGAGPEA